uniref:Integrase, catalytic region, zinc finger, CCHC-type, peptidase aspartic, catalytic n=1 Tax=Tanacetum cinerariifolium TaxID=118510 RepID=A0A699HNB6_TANCI|nr:integrase, catalytic region, zinc finger, CCHC-type, peptidase aspartic, catalytic [Tanacetum cinerariifolium]
MAGLQYNKFRGDKFKVILVLGIRVMLLVLGETIQVDRQVLLNVTTVKTEDLDTYDSDCDDLLNAQAVLMDNISNYGSGAQLQDKGSTICKLKDIIKSLREKSKEENVNYDYEEIETKNVELENSVAKLSSENERLCNEINHVKQVFKEQFDSIKKTRVHTKEQGKEIVDIAAQKPSANTIVLGMFKIDLEPLASKLLHNRKAHIDYLKYTQEQADILRGIVKQAKAKQPLDNALDFAYSGCSKHITGNRSQLMNFVSKFMGTVRLGNDHIARIMGDDWDHLFQPMFDEYFNPPTFVVSPVLVAATPRAVDLADSPVSTSIDQDASSAM